MRIIYLLFILMLTSCKAIVKSTFGRHYINHIHNEGNIINKDFYTEIPYEIEDGRIFLQINQKEAKEAYKFLFDTGAYSSISNTVVTNFKGYASDYQFSTKDVNGHKVPQTVFCLKNIQLGNLEINNKNIVVTNYPTSDFDGVVGSDLLKGKIFIFDPENKKVTITNDKEIIDKTQFDSYNINKSWDQRYYLKIKTNNKKKNYLIDSGFNGFLLVNESIDNTDVIHQKTFKVIISATSSIKTQKTTFIQLRNFKFNNIEIDTANVLQGNYYQGNLLGCQILNQDVTILDFLNNRMYLKKGLKINKIGIPLPDEDIAFSRLDNQIMAVTVNTELDNINIEPLDILTEINGEKIKHDSFNLEDLKKKASKEINHFVLKRNGKRIEVKLTKEMLGL